MDWLCNMHLLDRSGVIAGTREQLARLGRCTAVYVESALQDLSRTKAADVTERNGIVTVTNRRMRREYMLRNGNKLRKQRQRGKPPCHADVTGHKSVVSSHKSEEGGARARDESPPDAAVPTWEEVKKLADLRAIPEDSAKKFFDYYQGNSLWFNKFGRLIDWPYKLGTWAVNDRKTNENSRTSNNSNPRNTGVIVGPTTYGTTKPRSQREREAKALGGPLAADVPKPPANS